MTRRPLLLAIALVGVLSLACDDGDAGRPTARATAAFSPVTSATGLPCKLPDDVKSFRSTWRFKLEAPGGQDIARNLEATARAGPREALLRDPLEELAMILTAAMTGGAADIQMDVATVAPDRHEARIRVGDLRYTLIAVGQRAWLKVGEKDWEESPTLAEITPLVALPEMCRGFEAAFPTLPGPFGPLFPDHPGLFPDETPEAVVTPELPDVSGTESKDERANDIDTVHYHAELTDIAEILDYLGVPVDDPEALEALGDGRYDVGRMIFDWWLARDGNWPVRMEFTFTFKDEEAGDFREYGFLEVKDLNDPDIKIEPPIQNG